jgi:stearoyl-CoA desaturase (Delta-9 desaturase)
MRTPEHYLRNEKRRGARVINRAAEQLVAHFNSERIALAIVSTLHGPELFALQDMVRRARLNTEFS